MLDELKVRIGALRGEFEKNRDISDPAKKFSAQVGGMLEIETITIDQNEANRNLYGDINNDYGFRDIRLWVKGNGYGTLGYNVTLGFTGQLSFKNVMVKAKDLPILNEAYVGHFDIEMGMNYLLSTYDYTFVEQDTANGTFSFGRRIGVGSVHYGENRNIRWYTGVYTGRPILIGEGKHANENDDNVGILLNTRLTSVPIYREDACGHLTDVLHFGVAFCWSSPGKDAETGANRKTTLQAQPLDWFSDMSPLLYGELDADNYSVTGIEAAWQRNRVGLTGEGFIGSYEGYENAYGVSATGRALLTPGAYQEYNKDGGYFSGINIPETMRFVDYGTGRCLEGWGAWELVGSWGWIDLDTLRAVQDNDVFYGRMNQYTLALNWYWNPQTRWGINWIYAKPISGSGGIDESATSLDTIACQARITF
jgi:phosphate-selective porin